MVRNVRVHDCRRRVSGRVERSCAHAWVRRGCVGSGPEGETSRAPVRAKQCARMGAGESLQCERLVLVSPDEARDRVAREREMKSW